MSKILVLVLYATSAIAQCCARRRAVEAQRDAVIMSDFWRRVTAEAA